MHNKAAVCLLFVACACFAQDFPVSQSSDNNVMVGNPSQPVQWVHRGTIQQAILTAKPNGTVYIPATYTGTDCNPYSICNPGSVLIIDMRGGQFNTFPTGSGTCGSCFSTIFGRAGPILTANAADYSVTGIAQQGGNNGTLNLSTNVLGTGLFGSASNYFESFPTSNSGFQAWMRDQFDDRVLIGSLIGFPSTIANSNGWQLLSAGATGTFWAGNQTDLFGFVPGVGLVFDANASGLTINLPINANAGCTGCGSNPFAVDQFQIGTGVGTSSLLTAPQGVLAYNTFGGGSQNLHQGAASELSNGTSGTGQIILQTSPTLVSPALGSATYSVLTGNGAGPTQEDLTYNAIGMHAPQAAHSYTGVDASGAYQISSNNGNYFHPGPSSSILTALCGGTLGTNNATAYIFSPAQQSVTTCTSSSLSATTQEVPFPAPGTIQNLYCVENAAGSAGDAITLYKNGSASALTVPIGASTTGHDTSHTVTVAAGDTWSLRYVTNAANDTATGMRCTLEFVRTP